MQKSAPVRGDFEISPAGDSPVLFSWYARRKQGAGLCAVLMGKMEMSPKDRGRRA